MHHIFMEILKKSPGDGEALYRLVHIKLRADNVSAAKSILAQNRYNKNGWYYLSDGELQETQNNMDGKMDKYRTLTKEEERGKLKRKRKMNKRQARSRSLQKELC